MVRTTSENLRRRLEGSTQQAFHEIRKISRPNCVTNLAKVAIKRRLTTPWTENKTDSNAHFELFSVVCAENALWRNLRPYLTRKVWFWKMFFSKSLVL
ncbi:hypothetical protein L596_024224 [Steinernema carpocapsae]|uniref:Uncharacterized protein n=1 Tax=Steinernema carpocapsae TaxID=34508 RepID=A0A4U5MG30_STECR|nr:hypothetical protein L596_024224 [Steinernema carpocapsae]